MTVNCVNIGREEESLNIANTNLLVRFNKTREMFHSVTWVLSILLTTAATSANLERVNSKEPVPKVLCLIWAASYGLTDSQCMWMKNVLNLSWWRSLWLVSIQQEPPSWKSFVTCMYSVRYNPWLWQNNWHLYIQISNADNFN